MRIRSAKRIDSKHSLLHRLLRAKFASIIYVNIIDISQIDLPGI